MPINLIRCRISLEAVCEAGSSGDRLVQDSSVSCSNVRAYTAFRKLWITFEKMWNTRSGLLRVAGAPCKTACSALCAQGHAMAKPFDCTLAGTRKSVIIRRIMQVTRRLPLGRPNPASAALLVLPLNAPSSLPLLRHLGIQALHHTGGGLHSGAGKAYSHHAFARLLHRCRSAVECPPPATPLPPLLRHRSTALRSSASNRAQSRMTASGSVVSGGSNRLVTAGRNGQGVQAAGCLSERKARPAPCVQQSGVAVPPAGHAAAVACAQRSQAARHAPLRAQPTSCPKPPCRPPQPSPAHAHPTTA